MRYGVYSYLVQPYTGGHAQAVEVLVRAGAKVNLTNGSGGSTALC